jgi:hypothetical protein
VLLWSENFSPVPVVYDRLNQNGCFSNGTLFPTKCATIDQSPVDSDQN